MVKMLGFASAVVLFAAILTDALAQSNLTDCKDLACGNVVRPILTCVVQHDDIHFTAVFGYNNNAAENVSIPVGANNVFTSSPEDRGQPTSFRPGKHPGVFDVIFSDKLAWRLGSDVAMASKHSPRCSLECPTDQGAVDPRGNCLPLEQDTARVIKEDDVHGTGPDFAGLGSASAYILRQVRSKGLGDVKVITKSPKSLGEFDTLSGLSGQLALVGPVFVPHEEGTIESFDDKFALLIGGRAGVFTIQGRKVCVRDDGCFKKQGNAIATSRPSSITVCDLEFCTTNSSFENNFDFFIGAYCSRGAETSQSSGGYREDTHWCRKWGFIPWRCTTKRGTNSLAVSVRFLGSPLGDYFRADAKRDVTKLSGPPIKIWSFPFKDSFECTVPVVCASHTSSGNSSSRTGPDNRFVFAETGVGCD